MITLLGPARAYPYIPHLIMYTSKTDLHVLTLCLSARTGIIPGALRTRAGLIITSMCLGIAVERPS